MLAPDYAEYEQAIGLDWYEVDPNLRLLLDRLLPDGATARSPKASCPSTATWSDGGLHRGRRSTDKHGPVLIALRPVGPGCRDRRSPLEWVENKADLVRAGFGGGLQAHAGRPVPAVVTAAVAYLVSQADTALYCALGMTGGAADIVERYAPRSCGPSCSTASRRSIPMKRSRVECS